MRSFKNLLPAILRSRAAARHRERVSEAVRQTLLHDPRCWLLLLVGLALSLWAASSASDFESSLPVMSLVLTLQAWFWLGHALAGTRIDQAVAESNARCQLSEGFPYAGAASAGDQPHLHRSV